MLIWVKVDSKTTRLAADAGGLYRTSASIELAVNDDTDLEHIRSKLHAAKRHLEQARVASPVARSAELSEALAAYEAAIGSLPQLKVSGTSRVQLVTEVAEVGNLLRTEGVDV